VTTQDNPPGERLSRAFQHRLNELFATRARAGRGATNRQVATWMTEHGYAVKEAYLSALRGGHRTSPSLRIIEGLAAYFGVEPKDLLDTGEDPRKELRLALSDHGVEAFALRAEGLSEENVRAVTQLLDQMRRLESLPPVERGDEP
jgi:transcriptional regulator with XRE-family HTH domain